MSNKRKWINVILLYLGLLLFTWIIVFFTPNKPRILVDDVCAIMGDEIMTQTDCVYEMMN